MEALTKQKESRNPPEACSMVDSMMTLEKPNTASPILTGLHWTRAAGQRTTLSLLERENLGIITTDCRGILGDQMLHVDNCSRGLYKQIQDL